MKAIPRFRPTLGIADIVRSLQAKDSGDAVGAFAREFAAFIGVRYAVPAPSARGGLAAILRALALPAGAEVLVPGLTFHAVPAVVRMAGLRIRFVDINDDTYCLDPLRLERFVGPDTAAVIPVHMYGRACDMDRILEVAAAHHLHVIEDCAQACGARYGGRRVGSLGSAGIFSFHLAKNLPALNFGMVTTDSPELAERVSAFLNRVPRVTIAQTAIRIAIASAMDLVTTPVVWGGMMAPALRAFARIGFDPIEAATSERATLDPGDPGRAPRAIMGRIASRMLQRVDHDSERRRLNGERLRTALLGTPGLGLPAPSRAGENIHLSFVVRVDQRTRFRRLLLERGVDTHPGNMVAGPSWPGFQGLGECPVAVRVAPRLVHLPIHAGLRADDVDRVAAAVREAMGA